MFAFDKKVSDVDVSGSLTHALVPILLQLDCTSVVLENNVGFCFMSLRLQEILGP